MAGDILVIECTRLFIKADEAYAYWVQIGSAEHQQDDNGKLIAGNDIFAGSEVLRNPTSDFTEVAIELDLAAPDSTVYVAIWYRMSNEGRWYKRVVPYRAIPLSIACG